MTNTQQKMIKNKFKILAIDGGGIKGVFPALYLSLIEEELKDRPDGKTQIKDHFHLITGTSTGGIIALALSLGIPAKDIYDIYIDNADKIFRKRSFCNKILGIFRPFHSNKYLEKIIKEKFRESFDGLEPDPRLKDCKTDVAIPIYDLIKGNPSVLKSPYHPNFTRDFHIPAYKVAMATSAAPTFFLPYSSDYTDLKGFKKGFNNKIDGGVMANNPTLVGILEAIKAFNRKLEDLEILSIGTGYKKFNEGKPKKSNWGLFYWVNHKRQRLIELFMQSQSQLVENYISLLYQGIDKTEKDDTNFTYDRVNIELSDDNYIEMDENDSKKIKNFAELANAEFYENKTHIFETHFY